MHAAVIRSFDAPPGYEDLEVPGAAGEHEVLVEVLAAGLHPRVRSQANGSHYTSTEELPLIPGIDGVGRLPDGGLVYFVLPDTRWGSMATHAVIDRRRSIDLPADADVPLLAAAMNPGMSSWVALRRRAALQPGQSVLVLGATGNAGRMAVQVAKHLGAGRVTAVGRDRAKLERLPADESLLLDEVAGATGVDVVLDYLWGEPAAEAMASLVRRGRGPLTWVQIGSMAGTTSPIPSAALRAADLRVLGSGQGSVGTEGILEELPALACALGERDFGIEVKAVPLAEVAEAWSEPLGTSRTVVVP